jgi:hypothetical protein
MDRLGEISGIPNPASFVLVTSGECQTIWAPSRCKGVIQVTFHGMNSLLPDKRQLTGIHALTYILTFKPIFATKHSPFLN